MLRDRLYRLTKPLSQLVLLTALLPLGITTALLVKADNSWATVNVVRYPSGTPVQVCQPSDSNSNCGGSGSGNVGIGTINYIPEYIGVSTLGPTNIVNVNGNTGIGSVNPTSILDVTGGTIKALAVQANYFGTNNGVIEYEGNPAFFPNNLGIGSQSPGTTLDVNGTIRAGGIALPGGAQGQVIMQNSVGIGTWSTISSGGGSQTPWTQNINGAGYQLYSTGNVGINSSTPGQWLDVVGTTRILGIGQLGIGTSIPGAALDVQGSAHFSVSLDVNGTVTPALYTIGSNVGIGTVFVGGSGESALSVMNGNVGIGTWVPNQILDIGTNHNFTVTSGGQVTAATNYISSFNGNTFVGSAANDYMGSTSSTAGSLTKLNGGNSATSLLQLESTLTTGSTDSIQFLVGAAGATKAMVIQDNTNTANVGIGTVTPGAQLDINGTIRSTGFTLSGNGATTGYVLTATGGTGAANWQASSGGGASGWTVSGLNTYATSGGNIGIGTNTPNGPALEVESTWPVIFNALTTSTGNVGIGNNAPTEPLSVTGEVSIAPYLPQLLTNTALTGSSGSTPPTGWSQYVDGGANCTYSLSGANLTISKADDDDCGTYQAITTVNGQTYNVSYTFVSSTNGAFPFMKAGTTYSNSSYCNTNYGTGYTGLASCSFTATGTTSYIVMWVNAQNAGAWSAVVTTPSATLNSSSFQALQAEGGATVGYGYASNAPPSNGEIIQGNVGIGSSNPGYQLDVNGTIRNHSQVNTGACATIGPVGACWTSTGQQGYCSGAAGVCTTCTAC